MKDVWKRPRVSEIVLTTIIMLLKWNSIAIRIMISLKINMEICYINASCMVSIISKKHTFYFF